jgi:hypothetical protein
MAINGLFQLKIGPRMKMSCSQSKYSMHQKLMLLSDEWDFSKPRLIAFQW